jgi:iron complex outermembrane recepter protein
MNYPICFLAFCLLVFPTTSAFSQQSPHRLDDIVVTASRIESPLKEAPANVTVITSDDIEGTGAQTVADVVQREPGVFTQNLLGNPKGANIDIRGYGEAAPQNVLVLVNGRRVNGIDMSGADLAQIPVEAIERIEVYRGLGTVLYGDNAAAGVVNIILKAGEGPPKVVASTTVGSYNYFKPEVMISGKQGKFSFFTTLSNINTQGYRHNNEFYGKDALGSFKIDAFRNLSFNVSAGYHKDSYGQAGPLYWSDLRRGIVESKDSTHPNDTASTEDSFVDFEPEVKLGDNVLVSLGGSYRNRHISSSFDLGSSDFFLTKGQLETYAFTPKVVVSHPLGETAKNILIVGSDWYKYPTTATSSSLYFGSQSRKKQDVEKRDFAYYITDKLYPMTDLMIEGGYRRQRSTYDFKDAGLLSGVTESGTSRYDREAYRVSASYTLLDKANVFASYGKGFRFPATDEFITWGWYWNGSYIPTHINTALKPQTTKEFNVGVRWNPWRSFSGSVTYFRTDNRDEIYLNPLTYTNENYDKTRREGVETSLFFNLATGLTLNLTYSYTDASFEGGPFDGNRIPLVPRNKASAKLAYALSNWDFSLASVYTGDRHAISDQENAKEKLPGYTTFDAAMGYRYERLAVLFTIRNLADKRYSEYGVYNGYSDIGLYPSPGRQFFLTLKYVIGG